MNRSVGFLRSIVRLVFRDRLVCVQGESGAPFWFFPSEYPSLLKGMRRVEAEIRHEWSALLTPHEAIFDIGANIGFTVQRFLALLAGQCHVWAFEPLPRNIALLERNIECLQGKVTVVRCALGEHDGTALFTDNLRHGGLSRLRILDDASPLDAPFWRKVRNIEVQVITLDSFIADSSDVRPTFVKLDVEGAAHWVLKGGRRILEQFKPVISCSFHTPEERSGVLKILEEHGYKGVAVGKGKSCAWCELEDSSGNFAHPSDRRTIDFVSEPLDYPTADAGKSTQTVESHF